MEVEGSVKDLDVSRRGFLKASAAGLLAAAAVATLHAGGATVVKGAEEKLIKAAEGVPQAEAPAPGSFKITGTTRILEHFVSRGVKYIFGVAGSGERSMWDSLVRDEFRNKLKYIQCGQEHVAAQQAYGYASATEKCAVLLFHVGVGEPFAIPVLQSALEANVPLFMWTSGGTDIAGDWNQMAFQAWGRVSEMTAEYLKWHYRILDNTNLDHIINRAFRVGEAAPQGAVFVDQPQWAGEAEVKSSPMPKPDPANIQAADPEDVKYVAEKLNNAKNPWIITTRSGRYKANVPVLTQIAQWLGAGVIESSPQYMNFPTNHPCHQGYSVTAAKDADVVLVIDSYSTYAPANAWVVHVFDNPVYLSYAANETIFADSRSFLLELLKRIELHPKRQERMAALQKSQDALKAQWLASVKQRLDEYPPSIYRIWYEIDKAIEGYGRNDVILVWSPGYQQTSTIYTAFERKVPGCFYPSTMAPMGSIGRAIGVQLAEPNKRVIGAMGDWEFHQATMQENLYTCAHHNIPVVWVVLDNQSGATVRSSHFMYNQAINYYAMQGRPRYESVELDNPRLDYVTFAKSMGIPGKYVDKSDGIGPALAEALNRKTESTIISINGQCYTTFREGLSPERDKQKK